MNKSNVSVLPIMAAAAIALLCGAAARAEDAPNNSFRLGSYSVFYHTSADNVAGPYVPAGVNVEAQNLTTLYVGYIRHIWSRFDAELALGYPPLQKTQGVGPATLGSVPYNGVVVASARWIAPTLLLEYRLLNENSPWQPFIGVGVNYTVFYDRSTTAAGNAAFGGPTRLSLSSSVGPAATIGVGYHVSGPWHAYASYSIAQVKSDLTADTAGVVRTTNISFGPQTLILSLGYSFEPSARRAIASNMQFNEPWGDHEYNANLVFARIAVARGRRVAAVHTADGADREGGAGARKSVASIAKDQ